MPADLKQLILAAAALPVALLAVGSDAALAESRMTNLSSCYLERSDGTVINLNHLCDRSTAATARSRTSLVTPPTAVPSSTPVANAIESTRSDRSLTVSGGVRIGEQVPDDRHHQETASITIISGRRHYPGRFKRVPYGRAVHYNYRRPSRRSFRRRVYHHKYPKRHYFHPHYRHDGYRYRGNSRTSTRRYQRAIGNRQLRLPY